MSLRSPHSSSLVDFAKDSRQEPPGIPRAGSHVSARALGCAPAHRTLSCSALAASSFSLGRLLLTFLLLTSHAGCIPGDFVVTFGLLIWAAV